MADDPTTTLQAVHDFLTPFFRTRAEREAYLLPLLANWDGASGIEWEGSADVFASRLLDTLPTVYLKQVIQEVAKRQGSQRRQEAQVLCKRIDQNGWAGGRHSVRRDGADLKRFYDALLAAYDHAAFQRMLHFELNKSLEQIAIIRGNFSEIVFDVIERAEKEGWLVAFAQGAQRDNPTNQTLAQACQAIATAKTPPPSTTDLIEWVEAKWEALRYVDAYTPLQGHTSRRPRRKASKKRLRPIIARQEFRHFPWRNDVEAFLPREERTFEDAVGELQRIRRAVLLGDPGAGKTTTLVKIAAEQIKQAQADESAPMPFLVRMSEWGQPTERFADFLKRQAGDWAAWLEDYLENGRLSLLLDGINELPAVEHADKYDQVKRYVQAYPDLMVIVTCREHDYPEDRSLELDRVTVAPLDAVRIHEFACNYLDPLYDEAGGDDFFWQLAGAQAQERYEAFTNSVGGKVASPWTTFWLAQSLPDGVMWGWRELSNTYWEAWVRQRSQPANLLLLAQNPYMLFMLLEVYDDYGRQLPQNRGQLFDRFVTILLKREILQREQEDVTEETGYELQAALTTMAYGMQTSGLTILALSELDGYLSEQQRYLAASANLLTIGSDVRFSHQLLQEYFIARALRQRIMETKEAPLEPQTIWRPERWWEPTNWEEAIILLAGLYSDDCTPILKWLADAQPELAARCIAESGAATPEETKRWLRNRWLPRLTDINHDPDARARAAIGRALGRVYLADGTPLDNRRGVSFIIRGNERVPDIVWGKEIPAGRYTISGNEDDSGREKQEINIVKPYRLAKYPVTFVQFNCFVQAGDFHDERWWRGMPEVDEAYGTTYQLKELSQQAFSFATHPREQLSWFQAVAFCRWLSDKLGYTVTLPHEHQWEVAACFSEGRLYPWGEDFDSAKANTNMGESIGQTTAVGVYPHGNQPHTNLADLSGNVYEWCMNKFIDENMNEVDQSGDWRSLRGGSWSNHSRNARASCRHNNHPSNRDLGFQRLLVVFGCVLVVPHLMITDHCLRRASGSGGPAVRRL